MSVVGLSRENLENHRYVRRNIRVHAKCNIDDENCKNGGFRCIEMRQTYQRDPKDLVNMGGDDARRVDFAVRK